MTAANLFVSDRAAYLISDQALLDDDGTLVSRWSEVISSDRLKIAAITAGRGCAWKEDRTDVVPIHAQVSKVFAQAYNRGQILANLPFAVSEAHEEAVGGGHEGSCVEVYLAMWSDEHQRPEGRFIGSPGHHVSEVAPYRLVGASGVAMPEVDRAFWPDGDVTLESALRLVEQQRLTADEQGTYRVGVAAELTIVDAAGVRTETICRWPDRIGCKINPKADREASPWG